MKGIFFALVGLAGFLALPKKTDAQDRTYILYLDSVRRSHLEADVLTLDSLARSGGKLYAAIETPTIEDSEEYDQFKYVFQKQIDGYKLTAYDTDEGVEFKYKHTYEFDDKLRTLKLAWYERVGNDYYPIGDALSTSYQAALVALEYELEDCARFMHYKYGFVFK